MWVGGEGAHLIDREGERYLDLFGGYGVFAIGRNHPEAIAALEEVLAARTGNLPQLGVTLLSGVLAEQLLALAPGSVGAMVPANSGTEAVEAAIKISRACDGASARALRLARLPRAHAGLALAQRQRRVQGRLRSPAARLRGGSLRRRAGLKSELERGDVAAFVVEPIQGKGVNLPPPSYLESAQCLCRGAGTMFVCDEVQTGLGRTGRFLALEHWGLEPDMICLAKALSGGLVPIGATLVSRAAFEKVFDGMERAVRHGSTFGGNDLAAAAGLATLRVLEREDLVGHAQRMGKLLLELTEPLSERFQAVKDVRGVGLMWAIELGAPEGRASRSLWKAIERAQPGLFSQLVTVPLFHEHRIFCQVAGHRMNVIKALPPLVIEEGEVRRFAAALEEVLEAAERMPSALATLGLRVARQAATRQTAR